MTRLVLEAASLEAVEHALSEARGRVRVSGSGRRRGMRMTREQIGRVRLDHVAFTMDLRVRVDPAPADGLYIGQLNSGVLTSSSEGTQRRHEPGDVFLASQPGRARSSRLHDADVEVTVLPLDLISQAAGAAPGQAPVTFLGYAPASPSAARTWKDACAYVRGALLASPDISGQPLLAAAAVRLLAAAALAAFPNTATTAGPDGRDRRDVTPATLRRAVTFIDEHAHEDITPADIAAAAYATLRAVQLAFRRHMNTTPTGYLRRVRLDHAHRDLVAASPASTTVTAIAARWGFTSPSRFTAGYRRAYGCLPTHTLRQ
jgi:AraC-like DNA-binding protein